MLWTDGLVTERLSKVGKENSSKRKIIHDLLLRTRGFFTWVIQRGAFLISEKIIYESS